MQLQFGLLNAFRIDGKHAQTFRERLFVSGLAKFRQRLVDDNYT